VINNLSLDQCRRKIAQFLYEVLSVRARKAVQTQILGPSSYQGLKLVYIEALSLNMFSRAFVLTLSLVIFVLVLMIPIGLQLETDGFFFAGGLLGIASSVRENKYMLCLNTIIIVGNCFSIICKK
jgi:hypothetical protein